MTAPMSAPPPQAAKRMPNAADPPANRLSASHASPTLIGPVKARLTAAMRTTVPRTAGSAQAARSPAPMRASMLGARRKVGGRAAAAADQEDGQRGDAEGGRVRHERRARSDGAMNAPASAGPMRPMIWGDPWMIGIRRRELRPVRPSGRSC